MGTAASGEGAVTKGEIIGIEDRQETEVQTVLTDEATTHTKLSIKPGGKNKCFGNTPCRLILLTQETDAGLSVLDDFRSYVRPNCLARAARHLEALLLVGSVAQMSSSHVLLGHQFFEPVGLPRFADRGVTSNPVIDDRLEPATIQFIRPDKIHLDRYPPCRQSRTNKLLLIDFEQHFSLELIFFKDSAYHRF